MFKLTFVCYLSLSLFLSFPTGFSVLPTQLHTEQNVLPRAMYVLCIFRAYNNLNLQTQAICEKMHPSYN